LGGPGSYAYALVGMLDLAGEDRPAAGAHRHGCHEAGPQACLDRFGDCGLRYLCHGSKSASTPGRLPGAWRVLGDPGRRAAYDRALASGQAAAKPAPVPVPVRRVRPPGAAGPVPGPPLRVGPVRVSDSRAAPAGGREEDEIRLALLAALALHCLARDGGGLW